MEVLCVMEDPCGLQGKEIELDTHTLTHILNK
jgi:hypothetical protein